MKTEDKAAEVTLQQCRNEVASRYGYQQWHNVSFYEIDERLQVTSPPYAKVRLTDEVAELYASQVSASKDREIEDHKDLIQQLSKEVKDQSKTIEEHKDHIKRSEQAVEIIMGKWQRVCQKNEDQEKTISDQSKTIEELKEKLTEVKEVMNFLRMYGMIHTVKAVVYAEGSHEYFMKKAQALNS